MKKLILRIGLQLAVAGAALWTAASSQGATSIDYYGIKWTFATDRPTGTFANGEPWVVGPVTITQITPNPGQSVDGVQNGSMKNPIPGGKHGFDSHPVTQAATAYDPALNLALQLPLNLVAGDVLASSKTVLSYPNYFETVCVLTVLGSAPPAGSFRPGPYGKDRTIRFNKANIDYSVLRNLAPVAGAPTKADIEAKLPPLPWWEWTKVWNGGLLTPWRNVAAGNGGNGEPSTYGREIAFKWSDVGLWLNLNYSQADKEKAMIQTIQCGLDIWNYVINGGGFYHDGGHKCGRKFPVFLAAVALKDPTLLAFAADPDIFQEDTQTFIVQQSDVGRYVVPPSVTYSQADVGLPDWGIRHRWDPDKDDSRWDGGTPYRFVVWPAMGGAVLAAELMGRKAAWGHPPIFGYNARFKSVRGFAGFTGAMWDAYKDGTVPPPTSKVSAPSFSPGGGSYSAATSVTISSATTGASIRYTTDGTIPSRTAGTLYSGPVTIGVGTTSLNAIAYNSTDLDSTVTSASYVISDASQVAAPVISPAGGSFLTAQTVTLTSATTGATVRYTLDGSTPTSTSAVYSAPLTVSATTTLKARASKTGMTSSVVSEAQFNFGSFTSDTTWKNIAITPQTKSFTLSYELVPSTATVDAVVGLSASPAAVYADLAAIVRFGPTGVVDARDGAGYRADNPLTYQAGTSYRVVMTVDVPNHTYSATVTPANQPTVQVANNYAFRTEQATVSTLANLALTATGGTHTISSILLQSTLKVAAPTFTPGGGTLSGPTNVTIASATSGASIRYTTDGSTPSRTVGTVYTGPVAIGTGTTVLTALAYNNADLDSAVTSASYVVPTVSQVAAPVIAPAGGDFLTTQSVTLSTGTTGASLRYTLDGSTPTSTSTLYSAPLAVSLTTTVKAKAFKSGMTASAVTEALFNFSSFTSDSTWKNIAFKTQSKSFTFSFDVVPSVANVDALTGLSSAPAAAYADLAAIVRFGPTGTVDARDGAGYRADNALIYEAGIRYRVVMSVDVVNHRYSVSVTPANQAKVQIATNYEFRTDQAAVGSLANLALYAAGGTHTVSAVTLQTGPSAPKNLRVIE